jgi:hypothetical protein
MIAKPRAGSLKLIIGILQHSLKMRAFFGHLTAAAPIPFTGENGPLAN